MQSYSSMKEQSFRIIWFAELQAKLVNKKESKCMFVCMCTHIYMCNK